MAVKISSLLLGFWVEITQKRRTFNRQNSLFSNTLGFSHSKRPCHLWSWYFSNVLLNFGTQNPLHAALPQPAKHIAQEKTLPFWTWHVIETGESLTLLIPWTKNTLKVFNHQARHKETLHLEIEMFLKSKNFFQEISMLMGVLSWFSLLVSAEKFGLIRLPGASRNRKELTCDGNSWREKKMQPLFPAGPVFFCTASLVFHRFNSECDFFFPCLTPVIFSRGLAS